MSAAFKKSPRPMLAEASSSEQCEAACLPEGAWLGDLAKSPAQECWHLLTTVPSSVVPIVQEVRSPLEDSSTETLTQTRPP